MKDTKRKTSVVSNSYHRKTSLLKTINISAKQSIIPRYIEGDTNILQIYCLKKSCLKYTFSIFLLLITFGVYGLFQYWFQNVKRYAYYVFESDISKATHFYVQQWDRKWEIVEKKNFLVFECKSNKTSQIGFTSRQINYLYNPLINSFSAIEFEIEKKFSEILKSKLLPGQYLSNQDCVNLKSMYGSCRINIEVPSTWVILKEQVLHPFFVFQFYAITIWIVVQYIPYAIILFFISMITVVFNIVQIRTVLFKLKNMSDLMSKVLVVRNVNDTLEEFLIDSSDLVPGDILILEDLMKIPCDGILLQGKVMVNEASLTGEAIHILKTHIPNTDQMIYNHQRDKIFTLFAGTEVLQLRPSKPDEQVRVLVIRTGFSTLKGQLFRNILYPKNTIFNFEIDAYKILIVIFAMCLIIYFCFSKWIFSTWGNFLFKILNMITICIPPSLGAALTVSNTIGLKRLHEKGITCINPRKLPIAGKVETCIFDKTGTITLDGMTPKGFHFSSNGKFICLYEDLENLKHDFFAKKMDTDLMKGIEALGTCHSLEEQNNMLEGKLIGDPMEICIFNFSGYKFFRAKADVISFIIPFGSNLYTDVVAKFDFKAELQRMSVITLGLDTYTVCTKGAPESIKEICLQETIPKNFNNILITYAEKGYRILAIAYKNLVLNESSIDDLKDEEKLNRMDFEKDLRFVGFIILENKIKQESPHTIKLLKNADMMVKMCTGDDPITSINAAKESNIMENEEIPIIIDIIDSGTLNATLIIHSKIEDNEHNNESSILMEEGIDLRSSITQTSLIDLTNKETLNDLSEISIKIPIYKKFKTNTSNLLNDDEVKNPKFAEKFLHCISNPMFYKKIFVITGRAFEQIFVSSLSDSSESLKISVYSLLRKTAVFARMQPLQKAKLIELLQFMGHSCAMVGDGSNDCAAFQVADLSLALTQNEASMSAPFTSPVKTIVPLDLLLREGRCSLVNNFQCFKFMVIYAMIQFSSTMLSFWKKEKETSWQYFFVDAFIIIPLFSTTPLTLCAEKLSKNRTFDSLINYQTIFSIGGQCIIQALFQVVAVLYLDILYQNVWNTNKNVDSWFGCDYSKKKSGENVDTYYVTGLFFFGNYIVLAALITINHGKPFKKEWWTNKWLIITISLLLLYESLLMYFPQAGPQAFSDSCYLYVFPLPEILTALAFITFIVMYLYEKIFIQCFIAKEMMKSQSKKYLGYFEN